MALASVQQFRRGKLMNLPCPGLRIMTMGEDVDTSKACIRFDMVVWYPLNALL
jgi:hypothetical protein